MALAEIMRKKLTQRFEPEELILEDDSHRHHGHQGAGVGGESHFRVTIVSKAFEGLSRVARQRLVYETLAEELAGPVHALQITARSPGE